MASSGILWHNPKCSKSRQTLALLQEKGIELQVFEYLKEPITAEMITEVLQALKMKAAELLRTKEEPYKEMNLKDPLKTEPELIEAMMNYPKLIERPIFIFQGKAAIGRPPEQVLSLL